MEQVDRIAISLTYEEMNSMELIGEYIELVDVMEAMVQSEPKNNPELLAEWTVEYDHHTTQLQLLQGAIKSKVSNIDQFMVNLNKREFLLDAELEHLSQEQERIKRRKRALKNTQTYFNKRLLPMFIKSLGKDGKWDTDIAKYTLCETYGPVMVDPHLISDDFKKVEIKETIDKVKARKAAIQAHKADKPLPPGIAIHKVETVRRS